jgi:hypothetical protein
MCPIANPLFHQLGVAYCLRALCTQEAEPRSEVLRHADNFHFVIRLFSLNLHVLIIFSTMSTQ